MKKYENAFGKNDIRGIYGEDITEELYFNIGLGFVEWLKIQSNLNPDEMWITITKDARLHSDSLEKALIDGITSKGANVVKLGLAPTPIGYYSEVVGIDKAYTNGKNITAAAIITASHNPKEYNGLKMTFNKSTLSETQISEVKELTFKEMIAKSTLVETNSTVNSYDILPVYIEDMKSIFGKIGSGVKVVVDSANATGGVVGPQLYKELGCEVIELYSEPDGNFPNHHPNPSDEKTLDDLKKVVLENNADLGIAFDGDTDRIGVIDASGNFLTGDKLLYIYAQDLIKTSDDALITVVSEVKCSQVLFDNINKIGGKAVMCKTGHGYVKSMMRETGAVLAGEMSGHTFFKDRYHGFDDAVYAGCRIIEIISKQKKLNPNFKINDMLKPFAEVYSSSEVRYSCPNHLKKSTLEAYQRKVEENKDIFGSEILDIITLDGMRIVFDGGFALIRQSNTEPVFTLRFEAKDELQCNEFQNSMINSLDEILNK
ncbi:MAG: phosphomannomutase/phosphoglucomutase [Candidatus Gastranaerophilales bacterium]